MALGSRVVPKEPQLEVTRKIQLLSLTMNSNGYASNAPLATCLSTSTSSDTKKELTSKKNQRLESRTGLTPSKLCERKKRKKGSVALRRKKSRDAKSTPLNMKSRSKLDCKLLRERINPCMTHRTLLRPFTAKCFCATQCRKERCNCNCERRSRRSRSRFRSSGRNWRRSRWRSTTRR